jgi:hypothetical protein
MNKPLNYESACRMLTEATAYVEGMSSKQFTYKILEKSG